jgi:hypothetical protein
MRIEAPLSPIAVLPSPAVTSGEDFGGQGLGLLSRQVSHDHGRPEFREKAAARLPEIASAASHQDDLG